MSAIAGYVHLSEAPAERAVVERMCDAMAHRGPHGRSSWAEGPAALGHLLLHTTPESLHERQPLVSSDGALTLVADARLDNRDELLPLLFRSVSSDAPVTDSALILEACRRWGADAPAHLLGDFSFALWDASNRRLICARDGMGVKPFYYVHVPGKAFAFATEIRALLTLGFVTPRLNEDKVADYVLGTIGRTSTLYEGIVRLPAATVMVVEPGKPLHLTHYWTLDLERELPPASDEDYTEGFRDVFTKAVAARTRSAFPVGATLSGGLDSSSIAALARNLTAEARGATPFPTFSAIFPTVPEPARRRIDERRYMEAVLDTGGFAPHYLEADQRGPLTDLDRMLWHAEDIFRTLNLYLHWGMYERAQQVGVRVFLDGVDGDAAVSHGHARLTELAHAGAWEQLAAQIDALVPSPGGRQNFWREYGLPVLREHSLHFRWGRFLRDGQAIHTHSGIPWATLVRTYGLAPLLPTWMHAARQRTRGEEADGKRLIRPDFARRTGAFERYETWRSEGAGSATTTREAHRRGILAPLYQHMLELADKASAAFGIEARYPFFDRRLLEYCVALPAPQKLNDGWTRVVLRRATEGLLPDEVRWRRTKSNLSANFNLGLHRDRGVVERTLNGGGLAIAAYLDVQAVRTAYERFLQDPVNRSSEAFQVCSAVVLEIGLRRTGLV